MKKSFLFFMIKKILYLCYPKTEIEGLEHLPKEPCILVGNHAQIHGPIVGELYFSEDTLIWCAGQMMNLKEVPNYAFQDFWSQKPKRNHWFYKILAYLIAPLSAVVFTHARTIPVYRDHRVMTTFRESIKQLEDGKSIVIFPEYDRPYNHILYDFQDRFIDLARFFYKKTGKELQFVPFYLAPNLKKGVMGEPIPFSAEAPMEEERKRIKKELMENITKMAEKLPFHTVIPYRNIPKKNYPKNRRNP